MVNKPVIKTKATSFPAAALAALFKSESLSDEEIVDLSCAALVVIADNG